MVNIDPKLLEIVQIEANKAAEQVYAKKGTMFGVATIPTHEHTGVDSLPVSSQNVSGFIALPANSGDVVNPTTLGNQIVTQGDTRRGYGVFATVSQAVFPVYPVVIIGGGGSSDTSYSMTGIRPAGSTTGTLTVNFTGTSGTYATAFVSTEIKNVTFTNGSTSISWDTPLVYSSGGTGLSINGDSTFQGGDAPLGTMIIFVSELSLYPQIWVRANNGAGVEKWWGITMTDGIIGFTD